MLYEILVGTGLFEDRRLYDSTHTSSETTYLSAEPRQNASSSSSLATLSPQLVLVLVLVLLVPIFFPFWFQ
jgi:hypothetical protein